MWSDSFSANYDKDGMVDLVSSSKNQIATGREILAIQKLDQWVADAAQSTTNQFPLEEPKLVPPDIHLTGACWLSFRKYALSKGVQVGRREATPQERAECKDIRKGKMYMIWAKLPAHPSKAVACPDSNEKEPEAKRKEREQKKEEEKERLQKAKRQKVIAAYEAILQQQQQQHISASQSVSFNTTLPSSPQPAAAAALDSSLVPAPTPQEILNYAEEAYEKELKDIRVNIMNETRELKEKQEALEKDALELSKRIKASIFKTTMPTEKECFLCEEKCKLVVGECFHCQIQICADCLAHKIDNDRKCYLCVKAWLGKAKTGDKKSSLQKSQNKLAQFSCPFGPQPNHWCTPCCEKLVCDEHSLHYYYCCVCTCTRRLCMDCGCKRCKRCGEDACVKIHR